MNDDLHSLKSHSAVLRLYASKVKLERRGKDWFAFCPFHSDKTPSLCVSKASTGEWLFNCFGCSEGGDILKFIQKIDKTDFKTALATVQDFIGELPTSRVDQVFKNIEVAPAKEYKTFTLTQYAKLEDALEKSQTAQDWLKNERGISYETAKKLHFGFRQDLGDIAKGSEQAAKGWISFPCIRDGNVVSIEYRSIVDKSFRRQPGMATDLFNLDAVDVLTPVWLVEGKCDGAVLEQAGFACVSLPSAGFVLTPSMRDKLLEAEYIVLAGDCDGGAGVVAMDRLQADFGDRAIRVRWPQPHKDANEVFLKECKGDVGKFRDLCDQLLHEARAEPMPGVYNLVDVMRRSTQGVAADNPSRFHWPWKTVDEMANFLPGDIALVTATDTGMGKSQIVIQATVMGARQYDEVVVNYQAELSAEEVANIVTAQVLAKDRNTLVPEDYAKAANALGSLRYYVGADPTLTTASPVLDLIEQAVVRFGATVLVLDHIHFICRNSVNEVQEQANAMQRLKNMARKYGLKVIVVGQPRKADQKNEGRERQLNAVKGSETLVSDSSIVYFIHRNVIKNIDPANPPKDDYEPETTIRNKKARSKGTGVAYARLWFHGNISTFTEMLPDGAYLTNDSEFDIS